jgi:hypothetical protein
MNTSREKHTARSRNCIHVIARSPCDEAIHLSACRAMDCFAYARNDGSVACEGATFSVVIPAHAGIQYSETAVINRKAVAYWIVRS